MIKSIFQILSLLIWTTSSLTKCDASLTNAEILAAFKTIELEKINKVQKLVSTGKDINATDSKGFAPLHYAVEKGDIQTVCALLDAGADPNVFTVEIDKDKEAKNSKITPLHVLCMHGEPTPNSTAIVEKLIEAGADINATAHIPDALTSLTPIMLALLLENTELAKTLIKNKANVNIVTVIEEYPNMQPIHFAGFHKDLELISLLLKAGANINATTDSGETPLHILITEDGGTATQAQMFVDLGANINYQTINGRTPLIEACISGNTGVANYLIKAGADVNLKTNLGFSALDYAQGYHYSETVLLLIAAGAIKNLENETLISINNAILTNEMDSALNLIAKQVDLNRVDDKGQSPIVLAAKYGNAPIIKALLQAGADPNLHDEKRKIALFQAAYKDRMEAFEALIKSGSDVNLLNKNKNPLWVKTYRDGTKEMLDMLLSAGIDINYADKHGITMLHYACFNNDIDLAQKLIGLHAKINTADTNGLTPLHIAAQEGNAMILHLLIEAHVDINTLDALGLPPINYAASNGHSKIVQSLIKAGATFNTAYDARVPYFNEALYPYYEFFNQTWRIVKP